MCIRDRSGCQIGEHVSVHVRRHDHVELFGSHCKLVRSVVDQDVFRFDLRISRRNFLEGMLEHSFGELHDVCFCCAVNALPSCGYCEFKCELDDFFAACASDDLECCL